MSEGRDYCLQLVHRAREAWGRGVLREERGGIIVYSTHIELVRLGEGEGEC